MKKDCVICGIKFDARGSAITCSPLCGTEHKLQYDRRLYAATREQCRENQRKYRAAHPERIREQKRKINAKLRAAYLACKELNII